MQVVHQPGLDGIDPAVHLERLAATPGIAHEEVGGDILHLTHHVEFAQAVEAVLLAPYGVQFGAVVVGDLADRVQPVIDQPEPTTRMCFTFSTSTANCRTER
jgi:hypothetical protein